MGGSPWIAPPVAFSLRSVDQVHLAVREVLARHFLTHLSAGGPRALRRRRHTQGRVSHSWRCTMHERDHLCRDIDRQLEDAVRAKHQLDADRWRAQLRPDAMRIFAARTAKLTCSRALL